MPGPESRPPDLTAPDTADHQPLRLPNPACATAPEPSGLNLYLHGLSALFIYASQRTERPDCR